MATEIDEAMAAIDNAARKSADAEKAAAIMSQARIDLVMGRDAKAVYFATIAMRLKLEASESIDTAATDGKRIVYNPAFVVGLSRKQAVGTMAHEVLHVTNAHHARLGDRDLAKANIAMDLAINPVLRECGFELPPGALFPGEGEYADLPLGESFEGYYAAMQKPEPPPQDDQDDSQDDESDDGDESQDDSGGGDSDDESDDEQDGESDGESDGDGNGDSEAEADGGGEASGGDPGKCGGVIKPGKGSEAECAQAEAEAREMVAAAEQAVESSGRGDLPGGLRGAIKDLLEPKVDYRAVLREFVASHSKNDFAWTRPNRRMISRGLYLPGLHSEELGKVVVALDTSGSIGEELLRQFLSEVQAILEAYDCSLVIVYHHSNVYRVQEWKTTDGPLVLEQTESGGTSHVPVFEAIERDHFDAACIVCLTDLETMFPPRAPDAPTLWIRVGGGTSTAPFGRVVDAS